MITTHVQVGVVHGGGLVPVIQIYDADQAETMLILLNLEAAQKLVKDLIGSVEMIESLMVGSDDVTQ